MSANNITTCPKCNKENALFEYIYEYPRIRDGVFSVFFRAECKNKRGNGKKKCGFTYFFEFSRKVMDEDGETGMG